MRGGLVTRRMMRSAGVGRTLLVLLGLALVTLLLHPSPVDAGTHSATRYFPQSWALPGSDLVVTITATGYGGLGQVVEKLPEGFTYRESSLESGARPDGQTVAFTLLGDETFTYTVVVPAEEGVYSFSGILKDANKVEQAIGGHSELMVSATPPPTPTPVPTPTTTPTPTATATMPTPTPAPTPGPTPAPATHTPTPTSARTPTPAPTAQPLPVPLPTPASTPAPVTTTTRVWSPRSTLRLPPRAEPASTPIPSPASLPASPPTSTPPGAPTLTDAEASNAGAVATPASPADTSRGTGAPQPVAGDVSEERGVAWWLIVLIVLLGAVVAVAGVSAYASARRRRARRRGKVVRL